MKDLVLLPLPDRVASNPKMYFPLSLLYIAAAVKEAGFAVEIVDCRDGMKPLPPSRFYGFSCATPQIDEAKRIARTLDGQTIVGGAHASLLPNDCHKSFDYTVVGEGEHIIIDILAGNLDKGVHIAERIYDINTLKYPAWDLVDEPFSTTLFPGERYGEGPLAATIIGSRGCAWSCLFCGNVHKKPVKFRAVPNIIGEIEALISRGVRYYRFEDDNFTLIPCFQELCEELGDRGVHYKCHTRSDLLTMDKARMMKDSGCEECGLGVESADDKVLAKVNKGETVEDHLRAARILKEVGIRVKAYFVTGLPGETDETIELNKQFAVEADIDKWTVSTFTPYPGCPVYRRPGQFGVEIMNHDFSQWWNYSSAYNHRLEGQTREQMWARYEDLYSFLRGRE